MTSGNTCVWDLAWGLIRAAKSAVASRTHVCDNLHPAGCLGVGVELEQGAQVLEGVAAQTGAADGAGLGGVHHALDLVRVDEAGQVRVGHGQARQVEARLLLGGLCVCACKMTEALTNPRWNSPPYLTGVLSGIR